MLDIVTSIVVAGCWIAWCFELLQAITTKRRRAAVLLVGTAALGVVAMATRGVGSGLSVDWLRNQSLRSDAVALGAIVPTLALAVGTWSEERRGRFPRVAPLVAASLLCAVAGVAALAIGRSGWYWEFVAMIMGGMLLCVTCATSVVRGGGSADARVVAGTFAFIGAFLTVGGILLLVAWRTIA